MESNSLSRRGGIEFFITSRSILYFRHVEKNVLGEEQNSSTSLKRSLFNPIPSFPKLMTDFVAKKSKKILEKFSEQIPPTKKTYLH